jgi:TatA/E family protein of Tat protein translocase
MPPRSAATMRRTMWTPGPLEIIIVLVIVLVIFGPKRLPDLGRSLGRGMREFKDSVTGKDKEHEEIESKTVGDAPDSSSTTASTTAREPQS